MTVELGLATYDEAYTFYQDEFSLTVAAGNTRIWERANKRGVIYGVYLELSEGNYAVRCMVDGRHVSIRDKSVQEMVAAGLDIPNPVHPYAFVNDDKGVFTWFWTPREPRIAEYRDRVYLEIPAGVAVYGRVLYAEAPG